MTRFYFDYISQDGTTMDDVGTVLPNVAAAKTEAAIAAAEWIKDHASAQGVELALYIRDGTPNPLFRVTAGIRCQALRGTYREVDYLVEEIQPKKWRWKILPSLEAQPVATDASFRSREAAVQACINEIENGLERSRRANALGPADTNFPVI